jgi:hypothetical protein
VKLSDITGGALVESTNGDITVGVKALAPSRPLSFSSMNGRVTIRVPADLKAAIRFRTHRGTILTNFDDKVLVTRTEISRRVHKKAPKASSDKGPASPESAADVPAAAQPADADEQKALSREDESDGDWHAQMRDSIREAAVAAADAARQAAEAVHEQMDMARMELSTVAAPGSPIPPLPPMTGGKIVSGTLNGGGGEIQASTLNGDIVLKKAD